MTMLDSVDTLWVMGMHSEVDEAADYLKSHINFNEVCAPLPVQRGFFACRLKRWRAVPGPHIHSQTVQVSVSVSFMETTIRALGGLLAAHEVSGHQVFD